MKKKLATILCLAALLSLFTGVAYAYTRDVGSYDYYTGMYEGYWDFPTARDKYNSSVNAVDNVDVCDQVDYGAITYQTAVYIASGSGYGSRVTAWTNNTINAQNPDGRKELVYFSGRGTTTVDYKLRHNVPFFTWMEGTWCPDIS